ncbi:hypothetical protein [Pectobacterium aroidearum]|uniref:hypothetical protein n=1 Tax=Pectobacterium aroidearum TaxID=1201031 RepID=UPI0032ED7197
MFGFFGNGGTTLNLRKALDAIKKYEAEIKSELEKEKCRHCISIINEMLKNQKDWDELSPFNIKEMGGELSSRLMHFEPGNYDIDYIFSILFRFLMEVHFNKDNILADDAIKAKEFVINRKETFNEVAQRQINYAIHEMPFSIIRHNFQGDDIQLFIKAAKSEKSINESMTAREERIRLQLGRVEALKATLDEQENAFNFVGLHKGFHNLSRTKRVEAKAALFNTRLFGFLTIIPLIFEAIVLTVNSNGTWFDAFRIALIPAFALTFLLVYYFRISLSNYQSIKSQIVQIELRKALCTFIQKYSEYAREMKDNDSNSLDKFESIIFSNIMPSEDKIPSTFDGIEQIAKLIESIKR